MFLLDSNLLKPKVTGTSLNGSAVSTNITVDVENSDIEGDKKRKIKHQINIYNFYSFRT